MNICKKLFRNSCVLLEAVSSTEITKKELKLITRLRRGLSHLCQHKFKHSVQDSHNSICSCGNNIEMSTHFLIHFFNYRNRKLIHGMKHRREYFTRMWFTRNKTPLYGQKIQQNYFFLVTIIEWNKLEENNCNSESLNICKKLFRNSCVLLEAVSSTGIIKKELNY